MATAISNRTLAERLSKQANGNCEKCVCEGLCRAGTRDCVENILMWLTADSCSAIQASADSAQAQTQSGMKASAGGFSGAKRACMKEIHKLVEKNWLGWRIVLPEILYTKEKDWLYLESVLFVGKITGLKKEIVS